MNITKEDILCYTLIIIFVILLLKPSNLRYKHIHLTTALILSYLILFPNKHIEFRHKLYNIRSLLLIYFVIDFSVDPMISLFLFILYLMLVYQVKYEKITYTVESVEDFTNINTEVKKDVVYTDNYKYDNKQYQFENEYKKDKEEEDNNRKQVSDEQLKNISINELKHDMKEIATYRDGYSAQGTSFIVGSNFDKYGDLNNESNLF